MRSLPLSLYIYTDAHIISPHTLLLLLARSTLSHLIFRASNLRVDLRRVGLAAGSNATLLRQGRIALCLSRAH